MKALMTLRRWAQTGVLVLALLAMTSCGTENPVAPAPPAPTSDLLGGLLDDASRTVSGLTGTLMRCRPQAYAFDEDIIGPAGGTLTIGPHTLVIPSGALAVRTRIRGEIVTDTVNSVRLYPHGLVFERPARLTMSYANCNIVSTLLPKRIAYVSERLTILEFLLSLDDVLRKKVTGQVDHFSRYAISW